MRRGPSRRRAVLPRSSRYVLFSMTAVLADRRRAGAQEVRLHEKVLLILLAVVVVLIVAAVAVPFLLPTETYKQQIEAQVQRATGRALAIDGPLDISILPTAAVTAENVRFANVEGGTRPDMVRLKGIQAELKIWPLLRDRSRSTASF